jgi:type IV secretion system protein VirD4
MAPSPAFPPRGTGRQGVFEAAPRGLWLSPDQLDASWTYNEQATPDKILLGRRNGRYLGRSDDRHIVTIAGTRAGKSRSVLIPNLKRYRGSAVVIDPKGELAKETANLRASWGQKVYVLNPFNVMEWGTDGHNPCAELLSSPEETLTADAAQLADALIIDNPKDPHWTDSAKSLIVGLLLHTITTNIQALSITTLREQITRTGELPDLLQDMALNESLGGVIQNIGMSFFAKFRNVNGALETNEEMNSVLATATAQTWPLADLAPVFQKHDFNLEDLSKNDVSTTIYLILPATRIPTHARWLRLFVYQLLAALERNPIPRERLPLWLVLEEFAALGHIKSIEAAAGYFAGFGVKLWTILQDLTQIKTHYPSSWETFLGNAGVIQAFGNVDVTTTKYLSELLGQTTIIENQKNFVTAAQRTQGDDGIRQNLRSVPLLAPSEVTYHFARSTGRQLILVPGELPVYMDRLPISGETSDV